MPQPDRAVFRLPLVSVIFPLLLFVCATPLATYRSTTDGPYNAALLAVYLIPIFSLVYILLVRTVADGSAISVFGPTGRHHIEWSKLDGFEFHGQRWAIAVSLDGKRFRLPMVRPRDLPQLAAVSGGRLLLGDLAPDVAPAATDPDQAHSTESVDADPPVEMIGAVGAPEPTVPQLADGPSPSGA